MDRRRFLTLTADRHLELSCERLFMQCAGRPLDNPPHQDGHSESADEWDRWQPGEPPAVYATRTAAEVLAELEHELRSADVLRIVVSRWLSGELRAEFDRIARDFRARGGRVTVVS
jgi:hypothetical protein